MKRPAGGSRIAALNTRGAAAARVVTGIAPAIERYEAGFLFLAVIGLIGVLVRSSLRPFWFDELFTFYISRLPHLTQMLRAIPADGNPPLYYLLTRFCMRMFGGSEIVVRLPAIAGFTTANLATYFFVRRRCGAVPALFSVFVLATSGMLAYGSDARPYAVLLGFTGVAMLCWQAAAERTGRRLLPLLGLTLAIAGAIGSHHYGIFHVGIPLAFGEAVRLAKRRRFDLPMYGAGAAGLSTLALTAPFARETHRIMLGYVQQSLVFYAKPRLASLGSYGAMVSVPLLASFFLFLWITRAASASGDHRAARPAVEIPTYEIAAAFALALLVPIMIVITSVATGYYLPRYAIGASMGIAILMGFAAARLGRSQSHANAAASLCMILVVLAAAGKVTTKIVGRVLPISAKTAASNLALDIPAGDRPIVVASALAFLPDWWYAPAALRERLHYLADLPFAVRQRDFLPEFSLVVNQPFVPSKVDDYRQFLSEHREFLLYCSGEDQLEWTKDRLRADGWTLQLFSTSGKEALYLAQAPNR